MDAQGRDARRGARVLSSFIDATGLAEAASRLLAWSVAGEKRYACACSVHSVVTALRAPELAAALAGASLNVPDGAPVAWALRRQGFPAQRRVPGPDLFPLLCARAAQAGVPIYLYGGAHETLARLAERLPLRHPRLRIAGTDCPPYRPLSAAEDAAAVERINRSGARLVFVGLGCPKQELWMAAHRERIGAVLVGVGAAFDFEAGTALRAPRWMQAGGLEWLHRLAREPRRLWRRYLVTNSLFVAHMVMEELTGREGS